MLPIILVSLCLGSSHPLDTVQEFQVLPSLTDPKITEFNSAHYIYFDPKATAKNQLLVFIPGTNGKPGRVSKFCKTAATQGFQVINLMYPDATSASTVGKSTDPNAFLNFRLEVIEGKDLSKQVSVDRTNSIENRLIKLLQYLLKTRPTENWGQFLTSSGDIEWSKLALSGLSQGAGHACLMALLHPVSRAVMFGGPKDFDRSKNGPASWYSMKSATPKDKLFTFNNKQDRQGCNYEEQIENCKALGLVALGGMADVDKVQVPFRGSHVLFTNYPGTPVTSVKAHTSVVQDASTPNGKDGKPLFLSVWLYMLGTQ